ncbi:hypothetical protein KP509_07G066900 [Ceratopteris richardii]|uniref:Calmodulin n=1 Tax=Ceratopteris richardii TaxID=49495 RepID=A0A8T2UIP0_CERRI|nr:hypothetical protein KP509_07G066900 [Ceratopteris richardii]KAH7433385.1 hypothetical protein KP509_07G066900 [Ceratopteris richardii]
MADQPDLRSRLQRASTLYYERLPYALQQELCNAFKMMDKNGDGRLAQADLVHWGPLQQSASEGFPVSSCISSLFAFLDADDSGELAFEDCKSLFFIFIMPSEWCDGCGKLLLESVYECVECNRMKEKRLCADNFYLCSTCYGPGNTIRPSQYPRPKVFHPHPNFVEREGKLIAAMDEIIDQIKCSVCMSYHRGNVKGALLEHHIYAFEDNVSICEWCIVSSCAVCGTCFQGEPRAATSGGWAMKGSQICKSCQLFRPMRSNAPPKTAYSKEFFRKLASSDIFRECSTCVNKAKDGSLASEFSQGMSCSTQREYGLSRSTYGKIVQHMRRVHHSLKRMLRRLRTEVQHSSAKYGHRQNGAPYPRSPSSDYMHPFSNSKKPNMFTKQTLKMLRDFANAGFNMVKQDLNSFLGGDHPSSIQGLMQMMQSAFSSIGSGFLDPTTMDTNTESSSMEFNENFS